VWIERIEVEEGFLDGFVVDFTLGLNVPIGPRGTGKTSTGGTRAGEETQPTRTGPIRLQGVRRPASRSTRATNSGVRRRREAISA